MLARPDVDRERVVVIGIEHAGCGVPQALAFERRVTAAMLAPGIVDASRPWRSTSERVSETIDRRGLHVW